MFGKIINCIEFSNEQEHLHLSEMEGRACNVPPVYRKECGWPGITEDVCEARGCCFDPSIKDTKWCFKETESKY